MPMLRALFPNKLLLSLFLLKLIFLLSLRPLPFLCIFLLSEQPVLMVWMQAGDSLCSLTQLLP